MAGVVVMATLLGASSFAEVEESDAEDISYICEKERQKVELRYQAQLKEVKQYAHENSYEFFLKEPDVIDLARRRTETDAYFFKRNKKHGEFPYEATYQRHLREIARDRADEVKPALEAAKVRQIEIENQYKADMEKVERECQRQSDLLRDALEDKQERENQLKKEKEAADELARDAEKLEKTAEMYDRMDSVTAENTASMNRFMKRMKDPKEMIDIPAIPPGRFDPPRKRWDEYRIRNQCDPANSADSATIDVILKSASGDGKE